MNVRILGNVMVVQKQNDQKVASCTCTKTLHKWDKLVIVAKQCPQFSKPVLLKLTSEQLLEVLGLNA